MFCKAVQTIILISFLVTLQKGIINGQDQKVPIEVGKCSKVKKDVFEESTTFGFLIHNATDRVVTVDNCKQYGPFIVNGMNAEPKEFPHIARLGRVEPGREPKWFCGGTLISDRYVLTAAHCFLASEGEVNIVRLGELVFDNDTDDARPQDYVVKQYFGHDLYDDETVYNDIGLIELNETVQFDRYKHPACLPIVNDDKNMEYIAIGWGQLKFAEEASKILQKVKLTSISHTVCKDMIEHDKLPNGLNSSSQLCAGSDRFGDTCNGDSGGPLLAIHKDYPCMYIVSGITSTGVGSCGTRAPGIYTRVYPYVDWIKSKIWP